MQRRSSVILPRDVYKWLQSLNITNILKNPKRDLSNGYFIAELLSKYFPADVLLAAYTNASSLSSKTANWAHIEKVLLKHKISIPKESILGTIHLQEGAAETLITELYSKLTGRQVPEMNIPSTDSAYRSSHTAPTAISKLRTSIGHTEAKALPYQALCEKAESIIKEHTDSKRRMFLEKRQSLPTSTRGIKLREAERDEFQLPGKEKIKPDSPNKLYTSCKEITVNQRPRPNLITQKLNEDESSAGNKREKSARRQTISLIGY